MNVDKHQAIKQAIKQGGNPHNHDHGITKGLGHDVTFYIIQYSKGKKLNGCGGCRSL